MDRWTRAEQQEAAVESQTDSYNTIRYGLDAVDELLADQADWSWYREIPSPGSLNFDATGQDLYDNEEER